MFEHSIFSSCGSARGASATLNETRWSLVLLSFFALAVFCMPVTTLMAQSPTPVPVLTWRYDLTHAGQNTNETGLTQANVNVNSFGKLFSVAVDSTVYSLPLYVPGLTMSDGLMHNVLFVATSNDSIYAFDADSNGGANAKAIWQVSLLNTAHGAGAGATAVPWEDTGSPDVAPTIGITGTGTIDPATNTLYVVAATKENGAYFSRLHAINIVTGAEQPNSPVDITATIAGTGNGSSGGQLTFSPLWENQRSALDYYNGYVYFGYAAHGDNGPWHGFLFAYNAATMAQSGVLCLSPNGDGAGIWESGAGMPIDDDAPGGRMFLATGNGTHSTYPPFSANTELGQSIVDFSLANGGITPTDAFTSFNYKTLNTGDLDQGSGGVVMIPDQQGAHPHILVQEGKEGRILVLDRDQLGGYLAGAASNTNALQDLPNETKGYWGTPAYWNGNVYVWASGDTGSGGDVPKMYEITNGVLSPDPSSQSTIVSQFPGASFSVSSNGTQNGIAWAVRSDQFNTDGPAVLYAWNATDLTNTIYESDTNSARDAAGPANKFSIPIVTNGKVYVAAHGQVDVYGLFNAGPNAAAPTITPAGGTFSASQSVTLSTTTAAASIYYTQDGTLPTPASTLYTGPLTISADTTVKAIASAAGYVQSGVTSASFTLTGQTPPLSFSPAGGTYLSAQQVTLSDTDAAAKIYYTTDGTTPTAASTRYAGTIAVAASETIEAIAISSTRGSSNVESAAYVIQTSAPVGAFSLSATPTTAVAQGDSTTSTITVTPSNGFMGSVALTCAVTGSPSGAIDAPTCSSTAPAAISGAAAVTATLTLSSQATTSPGAYSATVTGSSGSVVETTSLAMTVSAPIATPAFTLNGAPISIASAGQSGTATITITPSGGFVGSVALTCAVTSSPTGAIDAPTCSAAVPAAISGTAPVTATLTINTTAASTAALHSPFQKIIGFGGGGALAALLFFALPLRRQKWQTLFGLLALLVIAGASIGCGNVIASKVPGGAGTNPPDSGTTAGSYTFTVTGTSGAAKATTAVAVTVE